MYDVSYFIKKFEAIPENDFGEQSIQNHCAYYHCDYAYTYEGEIARAFTALFGNSEFIAIHINDGINKNYQQPTPKQRILAALYDIKESEDAVQQTQEILNTAIL